MTLLVSHPLMDVHRKKLLSREETEKIISLAEVHAAAKGWTVKRHDNYATTDIPVVSDRNTLWRFRARSTERRNVLVSKSFQQMLGRRLYLSCMWPCSCV